MQGWHRHSKPHHWVNSVALANKESLVVAGEFIDMSLITPIDSEHFGLWYLMNERPISKLYITASGGAFREWELEQNERCHLFRCTQTSQLVYGEQDHDRFCYHDQ